MYEEIVLRWKKANPLTCHSLGLHEYDGQLPDYSKSAITSRIQELEKDIQFLASVSDADTTMEKFDYGLLVSKLKTELFQLDVQKEFTESPLSFIFPLAIIEISYTARSYAPIVTIVRSIIQFEHTIPSFLASAQETLKPALAQAKIHMSIAFLTGIISYFKDRLIEFVLQIEDESLIQEWSEVNVTAVASMETFLDALKTNYLPNSHHNFALGAEKFLELLEKTEGVKITVDRLLQIAEADLEENYQTMVKIGHEKGNLQAYLTDILDDHIDPDNMLAEVEITLERTRQFLIDNNIVSLPTDSQCKVIFTPEFARSFGFAAMNTPGPFEVPEASEAYYWVTPPDKNWSPEKQKLFLGFFSRAFLELITVHEAWPGHYLQLLYNNKATSTLGKLFARSTAMIEGWGHYSEEMIYEAGYDPFHDRTKLHVGQLIGALVRNVRFVSAVKMHCQGMTVKESKHLFMEKGFLTEPNAEIEANRGTVDPMYLAYTLGKLMIKKMRADYKKEQADNFSMREFHETMLSFGSPPIGVLRKMILKNPGTEEDVL